MPQKALLVLLLLSVGGCSRRDSSASIGGKQPLSKKEIVAVGEKFALDMNLPMDNLRVFYDEANRRWEAWFAHLRQTDSAEATALEQVFSNRSYQAVYIDFGPDVLDADCWLLVDRYSGEAIISLQDFSNEGELKEPG